jgi:hypothetical protein
VSWLFESVVYCWGKPPKRAPRRGPKDRVQKPCDRGLMPWSHWEHISTKHHLDMCATKVQHSPSATISVKPSTPTSPCAQQRTHCKANATFHWTRRYLQCTKTCLTLSVWSRRKQIQLKPMQYLFLGILKCNCIPWLFTSTTICVVYGCQCKESKCYFQNIFFFQNQKWLQNLCTKWQPNLLGRPFCYYERKGEAESQVTKESFFWSWRH